MRGAVEAGPPSLGWALESSPVTRRSLRVVVDELGPSEFSWTLLRRQRSSGLTEYVAASASPFRDYDEALDAGFVALEGYCTRPL